MFQAVRPLALGSQCGRRLQLKTHLHCRDLSFTRFRDPRWPKSISSSPPPEGRPRYSLQGDLIPVSVLGHLTPSLPRHVHPITHHQFGWPVGRARSARVSRVGTDMP